MDFSLVVHWWNSMHHICWRKEWTEQRKKLVAHENFVLGKKYIVIVDLLTWLKITSCEIPQSVNVYKRHYNTDASEHGCHRRQSLDDCREQKLILMLWCRRKDTVDFCQWSWWILPQSSPASLNQCSHSCSKLSRRPQAFCLKQPPLSNLLYRKL